MSAWLVNDVILWGCVAAALAVFGALLYSVAAYRHAPQAATDSMELRKAKELAWTLAPIAIMIAAAAPAIKNNDVRAQAEQRLPTIAATIESGKSVAHP